MRAKAQHDPTWPHMTSQVHGICRRSVSETASSLATAQQTPVLVFAKVIHPSGSSRARLGLSPLLSLTIAHPGARPTKREWIHV